MYKRIAATITVVVASLSVMLGFTSTANAATAPRYSSGVGWAVKYNSNGMWSLRHNFTYTVKFVTQDSRTKSTPYLKNTVSYLNSMPEMKSARTKFILSTEVKGGTNYKNKNWCGNPMGTITVALKYRPYNGKPNYSLSHPCYADDNSAWGGYIEMDSEYWSVRNKTTAWVYSMRNIHAHELGHMLGLDHPNPANYSKNEATPIMNTIAGGYMNSNAGKYPAADTRGIRRLIANG